MSSTDTDAPETTPQYYTATLKEGQTYVCKKIVFEYGEPKIIDARMYAYLRRTAKKNTVQGTEDEAKRVDVPYFEFAKVRKIVSEDQIATAAEDDDEDDMMDDYDLDEVVVTEAQVRDGMRGKPVISEDAPADLATSAPDSAPGAQPRRRARGAQ